MRKQLAATAITTFMLFLLVGRAQGNPITIVPADDAFVQDSDGDGVGDFVVNGFASVLVGFDAYIPGEHGEQRGLYDFDISSIPAGTQILSATLGLNVGGTRELAGVSPDPNLTLFGSEGDGHIEDADFAAGEFVASFVTTILDVPGFENVIDVTPLVQMILDDGGGFVQFVIRPNPLAPRASAGWLFTSNEQASVGLRPAELTITPVPEPGTLLLVAGGLMGVFRRRRVDSLSRRRHICIRTVGLHRSSPAGC